LLISDGELVNETLVAAFPDASHSLLLRLSKGAQPLDLPPGADLPPGSSAHIYLVEAGWLEVGSGPQPVVIAAGDGLDAPAVSGAVRAGDEGAKLLSLPADLVEPLLPAEPVFAEAGRSLRWFRLGRRQG